VLVGRYGPACFYIVARALTAPGMVPEHENARPIILRSTS
jgi:hypothetical protein